MIPRQRTPAPSFGPGDPRSRPDGIGWVTRAVFPGPEVRLTVGGEGDLRFAVVPSLDAARFLLPLPSRRVTAASVLAYNALRPPRVRASRAAIGLLARAGLLGVTRAPVLAVSGGPLLADHLAELLGVGPLHTAIGVRPPDPHHKPTLQLFDDQGRPRGYAKIGWNAGTRAMVRHEAETLAALPDPAGGFPAAPDRSPGPAARFPAAPDHTPGPAGPFPAAPDHTPGPAGPFPAAPRLLAHTRWQGCEVAVIEPMPRDVRRIRRPDRPRIAAMLAVARRGGPPRPPEPFGRSAFLARWRRRATGAAMAARESTVDAAIDAMAARYARLEVEFGDWHGDWVPWNMARRRGSLLVWDWENHSADVPVGFDLAHQAFQTTLSTQGRPAAECAAAVDDALARHGAALGLREPRFVADAYLIELWLRTYELSGGGAGWNPKLHPALLRILADRLLSRAAIDQS